MKFAFDATFHTILIKVREMKGLEYRAHISECGLQSIDCKVQSLKDFRKYSKHCSLAKVGKVLYYGTTMPIRANVINK
jgi:hypothetical protein